ncbi:MAG: hypothetical protein RLZZ11_668 [Cyanobacteriota bacterium]
MESQAAIRNQLTQLGSDRLQPRTDQTKAEIHSLLTALALVGGADRCPFLVTEQGQVDGAGQMPLGEFSRAAHIEHRSLTLKKGVDPETLRHGGRMQQQAWPDIVGQRRPS